MGDDPDLRYCTVKELPAALERHGIILRAWSCRPLILAMKATGAPMIMGRQVRPIDAIAWLHANPNWRPHTERKQAVYPIGTKGVSI